MKKYYLEILCKKNITDTPYYAQTGWVDSVKEVVKQYKKIKRFVRDMFDYEEFSDDFSCDIMYADWNEEEDTYGDIEIYGSIYTNEKGKVVY